MASKEPASYFVEFSPSAKAKCKKCMTSIDKGVLRIGTKIEDIDKGYATKVYNHIACFKVPNKQFPNIREFLATYLQDTSKEGTILQTHYDEILTALEQNSAPTSTSKKRTSTSSKGNNNDNDDDDSSNQTIMARIKQQYFKMESGEFDKEQFDQKKAGVNDSIPKKRKKSSNDDNEVIDVEEIISSSSLSNKNISDMTSDNNIIQYQASIYGKYYNMKSDTIKDILGYNRQVKTGTKDFLLYKLVDGISYNGRIARCTVCDGGRLKIIEDTNTSTNSVHATVVCSGTFDETIQIRIPCSFTCTTATAPRKQPWFMEEPTEEEKEIIDKEEAEARGEDVTTSSSSNGKGGKGTTSNDVIDELVELSKTNVKQWNLSNRDGLRKAAEDVISLIQLSTIKTIDIPTDNTKQNMQKVGQVLTQNRNSTVIDIIPIIVQLFGYKEDKIQKENKKQSNIANAIKNSNNGPLITAFQELSELYFKTGNRNAGSTYIKVVKALSDISFEINETNAKGLGAGKTKIPNIGKSTVDKILEFCQTGTMEKLEEKRSEVA